MQNSNLNQTPKPRSEKKWLLWGLIGFTGILLVTAVILFLQLKKPAAPLPSPKPAASPQLPEIKEATTVGVCELSFTVAASPSPSPSPSPSVSPSPSPSPEPTACFDTCENTTECETNLECLTVGGTKRCVKPSCTSETDCVCPEEKKACFDKCQSNNDCAEGRSCQTIPGTNDKRCVNPSCISESDCSCKQALVSPSPSPSPKVITYASPKPSLIAQTKGGQPELAEAGIAGPAVLGVSAGLLMILLGLLF